MKVGQCRTVTGSGTLREYTFLSVFITCLTPFVVIDLCLLCNRSGDGTVRIKERYIHYLKYM